MSIWRRIFKSGFLNFSRNGIVSWAAVLVTTITLSVFAGIILLQSVLHFVLEEIKNQVDVTIYFTEDASEERILALGSSLEKLPEVAEISYVSPEEALTIFREKHKDDHSSIQALDELEKNPLRARLDIKAKEVSQYETIANFMKSNDALVLGSANIIEKINYYQNKLVIDKLNSLISGVQKMGFLTTIILVFVSIIITFNTIRLTIFISKEEISVMRLVGASKMGVRGPFLIEGAIYGFIATFITMILFLPLTAWFARGTTDFLEINLFDYYLSNFFQILVIVLFSGITLGVVSSLLAIRKYLNK